MPNRGGDLRCFLAKNRALGHPHAKVGLLCSPRRGQQKDILLDMARSPASDTGGGSQKAMVGAERLVVGSGNVLNLPVGKGLLQLGRGSGGRLEGVGDEVGLPVPGGAQADAHRSWVRGGGMAQKNPGPLQEGAGNGERPSFGGGENIFVKGMPEMQNVGISLL